MRRFFLLMGVTFALLIAVSLAPNRASAMAIGAPVGALAAAEQTNLTEEVAYVCRRVWRCGPRGCGWRRVCWWRPGPVYAPRYFYGGPRWRARPYYRYRHWRRW